MKTCANDTCTRPVQGRGLCSTHYAAWHRAQKKYQITCVECGQVVMVSRPGMTCCSRRCRSNRGARVQSEYWASQRCTELAIYVPPKRTHEPTHIKTARRLTSGQCRVCGEWFVSHHLDTTCSSQCKRVRDRAWKRESEHNRRARKKDAFVANVYRRQVFESDGYRCHLCHGRTDPTKPVPHPKAPTIDHVIPLAQGGTHEPANCRTACFMCNALKSDRGGGEQMLLLAV